MNPKLTRWLAVASLAVATACPLVGRPAHAQPAGSVATVDQLKTDAFKAVRNGDIDAGNTLLGRAAKLAGGDRSVADMYRWTSQFEAQLKVFADERHKAYDKAAGNADTLVRKGMEDSALDYARVALVLSDDKSAFHTIPWVHALVADSTRHAAADEAAGDWPAAMRLYSDLVVVEPASREWKEKLKTATRRVRLIFTYDPDGLKPYQDKELAEAKVVESLVGTPTTKPAGGGATTGPAAGSTTRPADLSATNDNFKTDWHQTLRGIEMPMLATAMQYANNQYYRDVDYRGLLAGGIMGVDAVLQTKGLEKAFPKLADPAARAEFQKYLDHWKTLAAAAAGGDAAEPMMDAVLSTDGPDGILAVNHRTVDLPDAVIVSEFADGAFADLDPFTSMIWPSELDEFDKAIKGTFSGIGVQINLADNGDLKVVTPLPGGPAIRAGIQADDVIVAIDGKNAKHISTDQAVHTITGPSGTTVRLTVRSPDGTLKEYALKRQQIKVASVKGYVQKPDQTWDYYVDPANRIAYVRIGSFTGTTVNELHAVLDDLGDDVNGVIIDLRGNPGGLLTAAVGVCDTFLKSGTIVSTHPDRDTGNQPFIARATDDGREFTKPMVVLVNQLSASASEIVSGALKDDRRAILVGERTYGKGSVQQPFELEHRAARLKLTTAHYYLPNGRCIHREENSTEWGVDPDVKVEMTPEQMRSMNEVRLQMDVLREARAAPAEGRDAKLRDIAPPVAGVGPGATTREGSATTRPGDAQANPANPLGTKAAPKKGLLDTDPQLAAALLVLRLELTGTK